MSRIEKTLKRPAALLMVLVLVMGLFTGYTFNTNVIEASSFSAWLTVEEIASYTETVTTVETKRADELEGEDLTGWTLVYYLDAEEQQVSLTEYADLTEEEQAACRAVYQKTDVRVETISAEEYDPSNPAHSVDVSYSYTAHAQKDGDELDAGEFTAAFQPAAPTGSEASATVTYDGLTLEVSCSADALSSGGGKGEEAVWSIDWDGVESAGSSWKRNYTVQGGMTESRFALDDGSKEILTLDAEAAGVLCLAFQNDGETVDSKLYSGCVCALGESGTVYGTLAFSVTRDNQAPRLALTLDSGNEVRSADGKLFILPQRVEGVLQPIVLSGTVTEAHFSHEASAEDDPLQWENGNRFTYTLTPEEEALTALVLPAFRDAYGNQLMETTLGAHELFAEADGTLRLFVDLKAPEIDSKSITFHPEKDSRVENVYSTPGTVTWSVTDDSGVEQVKYLVLNEGTELSAEDVWTDATTETGYAAAIDKFEGEKLNLYIHATDKLDNSICKSFSFAIDNEEPQLVAVSVVNTETGLADEPTQDAAQSLFYNAPQTVRLVMEDAHFDQDSLATYQINGETVMSEAGSWTAVLDEEGQPTGQYALGLSVTNGETFSELVLNGMQDLLCNVFSGSNPAVSFTVDTVPPVLTLHTNEELYQLNGAWVVNKAVGEELTLSFTSADLQDAETAVTVDTEGSKITETNGVYTWTGTVTESDNGIIGLRFPLSAICDAAGNQAVHATLQNSAGAKIEALFRAAGEDEVLIPVKEDPLALEVAIENPGAAQSQAAPFDMTVTVSANRDSQEDATVALAGFSGGSCTAGAAQSSGWTEANGGYQGDYTLSITPKNNQEGEDSAILTVTAGDQESGVVTKQYSVPVKVDTLGPRATLRTETPYSHEGDSGNGTDYFPEAAKFEVTVTDANMKQQSTVTVNMKLEGGATETRTLTLENRTASFVISDVSVDGDNVMVTGGRKVVELTVLASEDKLGNAGGSAKYSNSIVVDTKGMDVKIVPPKGVLDDSQELQYIGKTSISVKDPETEEETETEQDATISVTIQSATLKEGASVTITQLDPETSQTFETVFPLKQQQESGAWTAIIELTETETDTVAGKLGAAECPVTRIAVGGSDSTGRTLEEVSDAVKNTNFVVDYTAPQVVSIALPMKKGNEGTNYYTEKQTIVVSVNERNLNGESSRIEVTAGGTKHTCSGLTWTRNEDTGYMETVITVTDDPKQVEEQNVAVLTTADEITEVHVIAEDKVGLTGENTESGRFVVDTVKPVVSFSDGLSDFSNYLANEGISPQSIGYAGQNKYLRMYVTDANFDKGGQTVTVSFGENGSRTLSADSTAWKKEDGQTERYYADLVLVETADIADNLTGYYVFATESGTLKEVSVSATDLAGLQGNGSKTLGEEIVVDTTPPEITAFTVPEGYNKDNQTIRVEVADINFDTENSVVSVKVDGENEAHSFGADKWVPDDPASPTVWTMEISVSDQTDTCDIVTAEAIQWVSIHAIDLAKNPTEKLVERSFVVDTADPEIKEFTVPEGYYQDNQTIRVRVADINFDTKNSVVSVQVDGEDEARSFGADKWVPDETVSPTVWTMEISVSDTTETCDIVTAEAILRVSVYAVDLAENKAVTSLTLEQENDAFFVERRFVVDTVAPVVQVKLPTPNDNTPNADGIDYYATAQEILVTVTEKNFNAENSSVAVTVGENVHTYQVSTAADAPFRWERGEGQNQWTVRFPVTDAAPEDNTGDNCVVTLDENQLGAPVSQITVRIEDQAANPAGQLDAGSNAQVSKENDIFTVAYKFVVDTVNPVVAVTLPDRNTASNTLENGIAYYQQAQDIVVSVTEANFDPERSAVEVTVGDGENTVTYNVSTEKNKPFRWERNSNVWTVRFPVIDVVPENEGQDSYVVTLDQDGLGAPVSRVTVNISEKAGNPAELREGSKGQKNEEDGSFFSDDRFIVDTQDPVINFADELKDFASLLEEEGIPPETIGYTGTAKYLRMYVTDANFDAEGQEVAAEIGLETVTIAGAGSFWQKDDKKACYYADLILVDASADERVPEGYYSVVTEAEGFKSATVKATDLAKRTSEEKSKLKGEVVVDLTPPEIRDFIVPAEGYYQDNQTIRVRVADVNFDTKNSVVSVQVDGEDEARSFGADKWVPDETVSPTVWTMEISVSDTTETCDIVTAEAILRVSVYAVDLAENKAVTSLTLEQENDAFFVERRFVVDTVAPVVQVKLPTPNDNTPNADGIDYYATAQEILVTVTEKNFNAENSSVAVTVGENVHTYQVSTAADAPFRWERGEGQNQWTVRFPVTDVVPEGDSQDKYVVTLDQDGLGAPVSKLSLTVLDKLNHEAELDTEHSSNQVSGENGSFSSDYRFIVDTVKPLVALTLPRMDENAQDGSNIDYYQEEQEIVVTLTDANFDAGNSAVEVTVGNGENPKTYAVSTEENMPFRWEQDKQDKTVWTVRFPVTDELQQKDRCVVTLDEETHLGIPVSQVTVKIQDLATNSLALDEEHSSKMSGKDGVFSSDYKFIVDTVNPVVAVKLPESSDASRIDNGVAYYQGAQEIVVTLNDANFDPERSSVVVTVGDGETAASYTVSTEDNKPFRWEQENNVWTVRLPVIDVVPENNSQGSYVVTLDEDGLGVPVRDVTVKIKDKASREADLNTEESSSSLRRQDDTISSSFAFVVDTVDPIVTITVPSESEADNQSLTYYGSQQVILVELTDANFDAENSTVVIVTGQGSGAKEYTVSTKEDADFRFVQGQEDRTQWTVRIPVTDVVPQNPSENGNYVMTLDGSTDMPVRSVTVTVKDKAARAGLRKLVDKEDLQKGENGTFQIRTNFIVDTVSPVITFSPRSFSVPAYVNRFVTIRITVSDLHLQISSGGPGQVSMDRWSTAAYGNWSATGNHSYSMTVTLKDGRYESAFTARVQDLAGHGASATIQTGFVVDTVNPEIEIQSPDNPLNTFNGRNYYNADQTIDVSVSDINIPTYTVSAVVNGTEISLPTQVSYLISDISGDILTDYGPLESLTVTATDAAGNRSSKTVMPNMVVDTTAPVVTARLGNSIASVFYRMDADGRIYYIVPTELTRNENAQATPTVETYTLTMQVMDRNIALADEQNSADYNTTYVSRLGSETWTRDGDMYTVVKQVTVRRNETGILEFDMRVIDLAGNLPENALAVGRDSQSGAPSAMVLDFSETGRVTIDARIDRRQSSTEEDSLPPTIELTPNQAPKEQNFGTAGVDLYDGSFTGFGMTIYDGRQSDENLQRSNSGLAEISWTLRDGLNGAFLSTANNANLLGSIQDDTLNQAVYQRAFQIPVILSGQNETQDVQLTVKASDNTGNEIYQDFFFAVDNLAPRVTVSYDNNDVRNDHYYRADRVATVHVEDMSFAPARTELFRIQTETATGGWTGDNGSFDLRIPYTQDGDYTLEMDLFDLAGNATLNDAVDYQGSTPTRFTLDKTPPVIAVTYNNDAVRNGKYYSATRAATITITEHNFDQNIDLEINIPADVERENPRPVAQPFTVGGDVHVSRVEYLYDGNYGLSVAYTDLAGNPAASYESPAFTIDTVPPEIVISGLEEINPDVVAPIVSITDTNFDDNGYMVNTNSFLLLGAAKETETITATTQTIPNGIQWLGADIEHVKSKDGIYELSVRAADLAGNEAESQIKTFSVNRFGSTYRSNDSQTLQLIGTKYSRQAVPLVISELNPNELDQSSIGVTMAYNGRVVTLERDTDYTVSKTGNSISGYTYNYTVMASIFENERGILQEGAYIITLSSRDAAGNANSNRSNTDENESVLELNFTLDATAPSISLAGIEDGENVQAISREVTVYFSDSDAVAELEIVLNGESVYRLTGDELNGLSGSYTFPLTEQNYEQTVQIVARDSAGNTTDLDSYHFYMNSNALNQILHWISTNPGIVVGGGSGVAAAVGGLIFLLSRRKKKKQQS